MGKSEDFINQHDKDMDTITNIVNDIIDFSFSSTVTPVELIGVFETAKFLLMQEVYHDAHDAGEE